MSARAWTLFAGVCAVWGIPYLFIKVAVDEGVPPVFLAWARVVLATALLLPLAWRAGSLSSLRGRGRWIVLYAIAEICIPFPLIAVGEQHIASSLAAIIIAAVPLIIALLALRFDHSERVTGSRLVGLFIGMAGVVLLVGVDVSGSTTELLGALAVLGAAVGYAVGPMTLKRTLSDLDPRAVTAAALLLAALVLTPPALADVPDEPLSGEAVLAIAVLGVMCTAVAFVLYAMLVAEIGPGRSSVITYVNPVVAVALGVTLLGERPGVGAIAGLLLILAGSWLSTDGRLPPGLGAVAGGLSRRGGRRARARPRSAQARRRAPDRPAAAR